VIWYGDNYERKLEVQLMNGEKAFTLKDFIDACEYESGNRERERERGGWGRERGERERGMDEK
jgi:hypothetical protein